MPKHKRMLAIAVSILLHTQTQAIVSGSENTSIFSAIKIVSFNQSGKKLANCTATLVSKNIAITAAHCFTDTRNKNLWKAYHQGKTYQLSDVLINTAYFETPFVEYADKNRGKTEIYSQKELSSFLDLTDVLKEIYNINAVDFIKEASFFVRDYVDDSTNELTRKINAIESLKKQWVDFYPKASKEIDIYIKNNTELTTHNYKIDQYLLNRNIGNDFAIIKLNKDAYKNSNTNTLVKEKKITAVTKDLTFSNEILTYVGFGSTNPIDEEASMNTKCLIGTNRCDFENSIYLTSQSDMLRYNSTTIGIDNAAISGGDSGGATLNSSLDLVGVIVQSKVDRENFYAKNISIRVFNESAKKTLLKAAQLGWNIAIRKDNGSVAYATANDFR